MLALCMLLSCVTVGLVPTDAAVTGDEAVGTQYDFNWNGTVYFRVPDTWDLTTYPAVRCVIRRSTDSTTSGYNVPVAMSVVGSTSYSRLYKCSLNVNHSTWHQNEFIAFFACQSGYTDEGAYALTNDGIGHYTVGYDYGVNNSGGAYLFFPSNAANNSTTSTNNSISGTYNDTEKDVMSHNTGTQTAHAYTNSSLSETGGTTTINAYYVKDDLSLENTTDVHIPTANYSNAAQGTKVIMTAAPKSGYYFAGWYSGTTTSTTLLSSAATYEYYAYNGVTAYAHFKTAETVTVNAGTGGKVNGSSSATVYAGPTNPVSLPAAVPDYGYRFVNWTTSDSGVNITNDSSADSATVTASANGTVTANFAVDNNLNIYVVGRFRYKQTASSGWTYTYASGDTDYWDDTDTRSIKLSATATDFVYKLETNASLAELSDTSAYGSETRTPYFRLKDFDKNVSFYPSSDNTAITASKMTLTEGTDSNKHLFFNSNLIDKPVTIFFNTKTKEIWYEVPDFYDVTCGAVSHGTISANVSRAKENDTVTLTANPANGYSFGSWTVKDSDNNSVTVTDNKFTMPAKNVTVTASFTENTHSIDVKRRLYKTDGTLMATENVQTVTGAGIDTAVTVDAAAATVGEYSFEKFADLPSGVTLASGSLSTKDAITVKATVDATIYIDYKETLHGITIANDGHGTVQKNNTDTISENIGYITPITLSAVPAAGYAVKEWVIAKNTATKVKINGTEYTLTDAETTISASVAGANPTFAFNGTATLTANFQAVPYTITAAFNNADNYNDPSQHDVPQDNLNSVRVEAHGYTIGSEYVINIHLAPGYEVVSVTGTGLSANPTISTSGSNVAYGYVLVASDVEAKVTLKAKKPTISSVTLNNVVNGAFTNTTFTTASGSVDHYYKQRLVAQAVTEDFATLTFQTKNSGNTLVETMSNKASRTDVTFNEYSNIIPATANGTIQYTMTVYATNTKYGVGSDNSESTYTYTVNVSFNDTQKEYFKLNKFWSRCIREDASNNPYYRTGAPIAEYNTSYDEAQVYIDAGYPAYDAGAEELAAAQAVANDFQTKYTNLIEYAKISTVYILSKYANNSSNPVNVSVTTNGTDADFNHFRMYAYGKEIDTDNPDNHLYHTVYYANVKKGTTDYYMYKYTFAGHAKVQVWRGTAADDAAMANNERLTGIITVPTGYNDYFINIYNTSVNSTSVTDCTVYEDFGHTQNNSKIYLEKGDVRTADDIKGSDMFNFRASGSVVASDPNPGITTSIKSFTIEGPINKAGVQSSEVNLLQRNFTARDQGQYTVKYTTKFGTDANGNEILRTATATLWVAFDDIDIYVDMNENVGIPILNFGYYADADGNPSETWGVGTLTQLPYEMDLVSGSESIYKYTIRISKLKDDYNIKFERNSSINISYITVEGENIGESSGGFNIGVDARYTGEVWFKADATKLTTFKAISYGSDNKTFLAVYDEDNSSKLLSSAVKRISGTGIVTDIDEIYHARYAADEGTSSIHYVLNAQMNEEVKIKIREDTVDGETVPVYAIYYFDKWVRYKATASDVSVNENTNIVTLPTSTPSDYSDAADLNFLKAAEYENGQENTGDAVYVARYKLAGISDSTVRLEITYNFEDYNTTDGNYVFDPNKGTVNASYTKTVKVPVGEGQTYANFAAVNKAAAVNNIANVNAPFISSNYYDYEYDTNPDATHALTFTAVEQESKIKVNAHIKKEERLYQITVSYGGTERTYTGRFQQTVALKASDFTSNVEDDTSDSFYWTDGKDDDLVEDDEGNVIAVGGTFNARYFYNDDSGNPERIKLVAGSGSVANSSVIVASYTERYDEGTTNMLRHNFTIIDHCAKGKLVGGGVLFATGSYTDASDSNTWSYRQQSATTNLEDSTKREKFIKDILNGDYDTEYPIQTISNIGFRYTPDNEEIFRWSDNLQAYLTQFEGTNVNSPNYADQKLRMFSFMVYNNGTDENPDYVIESSEGFAEVSRYLPQS